MPICCYSPCTCVCVAQSVSVIAESASRRNETDAYLDASCLSVPVHVRSMYCPSAGHVRLQPLHCASCSIVHSEETKRFAPQVSRHDVQTEYLSIAQSLLMKLTPGTQGFGQTRHSIVLFVPTPVHGGPAAIRFGGQSACVVHLAHP